MFEPAYKWPNPAFPFRIYWSSNECRVFIIENIPHNWSWLSKYSSRIKSADTFFVICGWNHSDWLASQSKKTIESLRLRQDRFFYLFNSHAEKKSLESVGFSGDLINHNAWLDENVAMRPLGIPKQYDAIYVARRSLFKRHMLAEKVARLAIVSGNNHGNDIAPVPPADFLNPAPLSSSQVCEKINQSLCGLILSEEEGACFASSEYLLCGIPVVSTHSKGGRDVWYDGYNSIVCEPDPTKISEAVAFFKNNPRDPDAIRANHIEEARKHRLRFIDAFERILHTHGVRGLDVHRYFYENYLHKMRTSMKPDFDTIFPLLS